MSDWTTKKCQPCSGDTPPMSAEQIEAHLASLEGWSYQDGALEKTYTFKNYYETTAFVNAAVWIAHTEDHHPDVAFGYKNCTVRYATHAIGGISDNDFICAAKTDALLK